ncbi:hypothetical protein [Roseicella aerolata]|uniref:Lipoprotein n=1 Tax=Roseicella aerolata TaxID=2883479 RepID=A0A9X1IAS6_9PROT|nr:hypothetical protein [Roseicella aerolata]MCB4820394.1 hypothetical protein [Roseicella aerolata]
MSRPRLAAVTLTASLALLAACQNPTRTSTVPQPGASAAAPVVPGTARIMGGSSNADIQRVEQGTGAQAPIVPGTGRIMGGISNAEVQRTTPGAGVQAPIVPGTGQIMGGISNAEVQRSGGGAPAPGSTPR